MDERGESGGEWPGHVDTLVDSQELDEVERRINALSFIGTSTNTACDAYCAKPPDRTLPIVCSM